MYVIKTIAAVISEVNLLGLEVFLHFFLLCCNKKKTDFRKTQTQPHCDQTTKIGMRSANLASATGNMFNFSYLGHACYTLWTKC